MRNGVSTSAGRPRRVFRALTELAARFERVGAPPPHTVSRFSFRIAPPSVPTALSASDIRSRITLNAECPLPTTRTRLPAYAADRRRGHWGCRMPRDRRAHAHPRRRLRRSPPDRRSPRAAGINHRAGLDRLALVQANLERLLIAAWSASCRSPCGPPNDARVESHMRRESPGASPAAQRISSTSSWPVGIASASGDCQPADSSSSRAAPSTM